MAPKKIAVWTATADQMLLMHFIKNANHKVKHGTAATLLTAANIEGNEGKTFTESKVYNKFKELKYMAKKSGVATLAPKEQNKKAAPKIGSGASKKSTGKKHAMEDEDGVESKKVKLSTDSGGHEVDEEPGDVVASMEAEAKAAGDAAAKAVLEDDD